jgi:hypothetical protein
VTPIIRPATREDIKAYAPDKLAPTIRALCMELDGRIIAIAGVWRVGSRWRAFADLPEEARQYKFRIARAARRFFEELRRDGIAYVYAEMDETEPRSCDWLASLGFEIDPRSLILYRWSA